MISAAHGKDAKRRVAARGIAKRVDAVNASPMTNRFVRPELQPQVGGSRSTSSVWPRESQCLSLDAVPILGAWSTPRIAALSSTVSKSAGSRRPPRTSRRRAEGRAAAPAGTGGLSSWTRTSWSSTPAVGADPTQGPAAGGRCCATVSRPRDVWWRVRPDQQQPDGIDRADHRAGGAHPTGGSASLHR